ncbi:uncharacterized protein METZ01_LOCUS439552 [marine metagenome]|uniref:Uncharacterized protein n=1 Tax=marine metagenome TaxID=408172 RepID=A0A382YVY6_9ZZZZ
MPGMHDEAVAGRNSVNQRLPSESPAS